MVHFVAWNTHIIALNLNSSVLNTNSHRETTFCRGAKILRACYYFLSEQDLNQQLQDEAILLQEQ